MRRRAAGQLKNLQNHTKQRQIHYPPRQVRHPIARQMHQQQTKNRQHQQLPQNSQRGINLTQKNRRQNLAQQGKIHPNFPGPNTLPKLLQSLRTGRFAQIIRHISNGLLQTNRIKGNRIYIHGNIFTTLSKMFTTIGTANSNTTTLAASSTLAASALSPASRQSPAANSAT